MYLSDVELKHEGAVAACQRTLVRQLRIRFKKVPAEIEATVEMTKDLPQLEEWLDAVVTAKTLKGVGIDPERGRQAVELETQLLRLRLYCTLRPFGAIPTEVQAAIDGMTDQDLLCDWINRAESAKSRKEAFWH